MEKSDLEIGLAALKREDFVKAIAILEKVCERELHQPTRDRAQMGLVMAYEGNRASDRAIALCQSMTRSDSPKVKNWAVGTLAKLCDRYPQSQPSTAQGSLSQKNQTVKSPTPDPTGFIPLENPPSTPPAPTTFPDRSIPASARKSDRTGFVPLDNPSPPSAAPTPHIKNRQPQSKTPIPPPIPLKPQAPAKAPAGDRAGFGNGDRSPSAKVPAAPTPLTSDRKSPRKTSPMPPPMPPNPKARASDRPGFVPQSDARSSSDRPDLLLTEEEIAAFEPEEFATPEPTPQPPQWRQAGRAQNWRKLKPVKPSRLFFTQLASAIALVWLLRLLLNGTMATTNTLLYKLPLLWPIQAFYRDQTWTLLGVLGVMLVASPWLLDLLLKFGYGMAKLPPQTLGNSSPEARKLISRYCFDRKLPMVSLGVIPTDAPIAITYGCVPRFARIVVSQGLLEQLEDDEIAAIYAGELGHLENWDFPLMSLAVLLCQIPYLIYWQVGSEADKWLNANSLLQKVMLTLAAVISAIAYGLYWLLRWPVLFLSRLRFYYSDRVAASLTGNPNGLTRALLKIAIGIAKDIEKQGQTSFVLEGFDLLTPIGCVRGMTLGSCCAYASWETLLEWDRRNPYSKWLAVNNADPPLGDRLTLLDLYARFWKLDTELDFGSAGDKQTPSKPQRQWQRLGLQGAPYFGLPLGLMLGGLLWAIGAFASQLGVEALDWVWGDRSILYGSLAIGIGIGIFIRINPFFPDITPSNQLSDPWLPDLLEDVSAIPLDSQPICLSGTLLGRRGVSNWLAQDLILHSSRGLVKLHGFSAIGPLGYLWLGKQRESDWVGNEIAAIGWFRRGATPWIDIERLKAPDGKTRYSSHPIWSTLLAAIAALWGAYLISQGGT